jgi:hypothetical protein
MACSLFNICLSLFLERPSQTGRVIALDEAHKYMKDSGDSQTLTASLLETIRLQRHLGTRVIISTQEPTISPALLDLCSTTIVHRFTSPDWLSVLRRHLAGASVAPKLMAKIEGSAGSPGGLEDRFHALSMGSKDKEMELFSRIVALRVGEALLFSPSAVVGIRKRTGRLQSDIQRLTQDVLHIRVRKRVTQDGGRSVMAT